MGRFSELLFGAERTVEEERKERYAPFFRFCKRQTSILSTFLDSGSDEIDSDKDDWEEVPLAEANLVCSDRQSTGLQRSDGEPLILHIPVLDIDMPAMLIPSSSKDHYHLYIDKPMTWENYVKLLDVMAEVGILEPGYVDVSKKRKRTQVRTPWTEKGK